MARRTDFRGLYPQDSLESYREFLREIVRLRLVDSVSPIQYTVRLLVLDGSMLLSMGGASDASVGESVEDQFSYAGRISIRRWIISSATVRN